MNQQKQGGARKPGSVPPRQNPLQTAHQKAVESLGGQSEAQLDWLGAERVGERWRVPVMDGVFLVDVDTGKVCRDDDAEVRPTWQILALHYLAVRTQTVSGAPEITFASLPSAKTYAVVYENRVNRRLCATVGKDKTALQSAATAVNARHVAGGDVAFEVNVFPHIPVRLIWYSGDDELPPACTLLLPANIESFLCIEDIVVLSESFVSRLCAKPF